MFVSHTHKLIFLEVPRTGSRSISRALMRFDPDAPTSVSRQEKVSADYHRFDCPEMDDPSYRVIATHRNPYDRLWSFWKHRRSTGNPPIFTNVDWPTYVDWVVEPERVPELAGVLVDKPISDMFPVERVDHWLSFEDLEGSWQELAETLELSLPALDRINASPDHGELANAYGIERADRVYAHFKADFERFAYSAESWHPAPATLPSPGNETRTRPVVAVLTTLGKPHEAFSIERVIRDQLSMLMLHDYEPVLVVTRSKYWKAPDGIYADPRIQIKEIDRPGTANEEGEEEAFFADIDALREQLAAALEGVDVVLTHDLIYMPDQLKLCVAARQLASSLPAVRWLHWIHSATTPLLLKRKGISGELFPEVLSAPWPGSFPVYFNRMSIPRIAGNFNYTEHDVKIVPHATDVCDYLGLSEPVRRLYRERRLHQADYISVMPVRLDRGKQVEWVLKILARLKAQGAQVRVIVVDFHSQAEDKGEYREYLKELAVRWGLGPRELSFTSELDESLRAESPRSLVRELFSLANVFIQASRSESYSLVTQEAAMMGNLLVLNDDFPPMREIFGEDAIYCRFGSNIDRLSLQDGDTVLEFSAIEVDAEPADYPSSLYREEGDRWLIDGEAVYADTIARRIQHEFGHNKVLAQRQRRLRDRNLYSVFRRHLEPLILAVWRD